MTEGERLVRPADYFARTGYQTDEEVRYINEHFNPHYVPPAALPWYRKPFWQGFLLGLLYDIVKHLAQGKSPILGVPYKR
jgi:hypothetical protein